LITDFPRLSEPSFSGRQNEIARLAEYLQECLKGKGRTVFVVGEAGIGKTRLANELIDRANELGFRVLRGQCLPGSPSPYIPFEDALRDFFKISKEDSDAIAKGKISDTIRRQAPEISEAVENIGLLLKTGSVIAVQEKEVGLRAWLKGTRQEREIGLKEWLKGPKPLAYQEYTVDMSRAESLKERFLQTVSSLIVEVAKREPVLLFLDDLHWADPSSLALLHLISRRIKDSRALIIGAYRSEELVGKEGPIVLAETLQLMSREDLFVKIELKPLGKEAYSKILRHTFQSDFGNEFVDRVYDETEGNPLFALETLRLLVEEGAIQPRNGNWALSLPVSKVRIPDKVKDVILRRVARVSEEDRRILELAAVIGEEFESPTIQELLGINRLKALQSLSSIEKMHTLIQSVESGYRFTHSKVREVIYGELTPELTREYHSMVGDWMEKQYSSTEKLDEAVPMIAHHFYLGQQWDKALTYLAMAGDMAMQIHAHHEAHEAYNTALEASRLVKTPLSSAISSSLLERKALAAMASSKIDEALGDFSVLAETGQSTMDDALYAKAQLLHAWASFWNKDLETALKDCSEALRVARELADKTLEARSLYLTGTTLLARGSRKEAKEYLNKSLRISREAGDKVAETQTLLVLLMEGFSQ